MMTRAWSRWPAATEQQCASGPVSHQEVARVGEGTNVGKLTEGKVEIKRFKGVFEERKGPYCLANEELQLPVHQLRKACSFLFPSIPTHFKRELLSLLFSRANVKGMGKFFAAAGG